MQTLNNYPNKKDKVSAKSMLKSISNSRNESKKIAINILGETTQFILPIEASESIINLLKNIASGNLARTKLLTTQSASELIGVSRPYFVKLLESGEIPFVKVGSHRRVNEAEVLNYKIKMIAKREMQINFLQKQAQELNLGYE